MGADTGQLLSFSIDSASLAYNLMPDLRLGLFGKLEVGFYDFRHLI